MSYVVRNGLLVPKKEVVRRGATHVRVPRANLILRRIADPILRPARMAVGFDAAGTASSFGTVTGATGLTDSNLTVSAAGNCVIYLVSANSVSSLAGVAAHWDSAGANQAMTSIVTVGNTNGFQPQVVYIFGLVAPSTGNKTFKLSGTWGTALPIVVFGCSFTGANQAGGATTFNYTGTHTNVSSSTAVTVTCTTTANDAVVACMNGVNNAGTETIAMGQTSLFASTPGTTYAASGGNYELGGTPTVTMTGTLSASDFWAAVATNIAGAVSVVVASPAAGLMGLASCEW